MRLKRCSKSADPLAGTFQSLYILCSFAVKVSPRRTRRNTKNDNENETFQRMKQFNFPTTIINIMKQLFALAIGLLFATCFSVEAAEYYVSPAGTAAAAGTANDPFGSLEPARDAIRLARSAGTLQPDEAVTVHVAPGDYFFTQGFELRKEDSGTKDAPVIYRSEKPFEAKLIGGVTLPASVWKRVEAPAIFGRLDHSVRRQIRVADLNELDIPAMKEWGDQFRGRPDAPPELIFNEQPMTVARYPNEGWLEFKTALDSGNPHDEQAEERTQTIAQQAGVTFIHPDVDTTKKHGGAFLYDEEGLSTRTAERFDRWNVADGVWLFGYWTHDWAEQVLKVAHIDTQQKILLLQGIHHYEIGGTSWSDFKERRYFVMNVLEELDAPGEWYLDRQANRLYFYPPSRIENATVVLSILEQPLITLRDAENIQLQGFSLGPTFGQGVAIQDGTNNVILGCRIKNTGQGGVSLHGGTVNRVQSCDLENIGSTGIVISGGDRRTLTPAGNMAVNNHVKNFGRWARTYNGAISVHGVGNIVRNNKMHEGPHLAVAYGGNENRIERNEIFNVLSETSDAGALYTGRDWTTQGNIIAENFIHNIGVADVNHTMGVYIDDCDSGDTIERNIFYRAKRAVFIGGGRDNIARSNLFIECYQGIHLDSRGMTWRQWNTPGDGWNLEEKAEALDYKNPPWSTRYPKLATIMSNMPQAPLGNIFANNVMIDCTMWLHLDGNVLGLLERDDIEDNIIIRENLIIENAVKSADAKLPPNKQGLQRFLQNVEPEFRNPRKMDFRFTEGSPLSEALPEGFDIPYENIGIYIDEYRTSVR